MIVASLLPLVVNDRYASSIKSFSFYFFLFPVKNVSVAESREYKRPFGLVSDDYDSVTVPYRMPDML